jgi:hypothetical protein
MSGILKLFGGSGAIESVPKPSPISGVIDCPPLGDKEGTVVRVGMHVIGYKRLRVLNLLPGVTFVAGLPNLPVPELNEHGLETGKSIRGQKQ